VPPYYGTHHCWERNNMEFLWQKRKRRMCIIRLCIQEKTILRTWMYCCRKQWQKIATARASYSILPEIHTIYYYYIN
jgi:hypothetical protein